MLTMVLMAGMIIIPAKAVKAAEVKDASGSVVTEITAQDINKTSSFATYQGTVTSVTDPTVIIPIKVSSAGTVYVDLDGIAVGEGVTASLHSLADATDGSQIASSFLYGDARTKSIAASVKKAGTIYLKLATSADNYSFSKEEQQVVEFTVKSAPQGGTLTNGKTFNGCSPDDGIAYYKVKVTKPGYIRVKLSSEDNYPSFYVNLCNSKKQKYAQNDERLSSSDNHTALFAVNKGSYYIAVKSRASIYGINSKFAAVAEKSGTSRSKAVAIKKGTTKKGIILSSEKKSKADWYKFTISKSQRVEFTFSGSTTLGHIQLEMYRAGDSSRFGSKTISGLDQKATVSPYTFGNNNKLTKGTYYIKVTKGSYATSNGYYSLKWK